ncbi:unannotated protein [freshwater metagenome]|uniref:Unannotated protein n=1 Tax=freshwater metagenome TaxID=449393 RepID=A0A6J6CG51_9ZZZZ
MKPAPSVVAIIWVTEPLLVVVAPPEIAIDKLVAGSEYEIFAIPEPVLPVIVPPDGFGIVAFPAVSVELRTPPTYPEPPPLPIPQPAPPPPQ